MLLASGTVPPVKSLTSLMAPRLPELMKGRYVTARMGLAILGSCSAVVTHWSAPWNLPGSPHQGDPPAALGRFFRSLPIVKPFMSEVVVSTSASKDLKLT